MASCAVVPCFVGAHERPSKRGVKPGSRTGVERHTRGSRELPSPFLNAPKEGEGVEFSANVTHRFQVGMRWILVLERRRRTRGFAPHAIGKLVTPPPAPPQLDVTWSLLSGLTV